MSSPSISSHICCGLKICPIHGVSNALSIISPHTVCTRIVMENPVITQWFPPYPSACVSLPVLTFLLLPARAQSHLVSWISSLHPCLSSALRLRWTSFHFPASFPSLSLLAWLLPLSGGCIWKSFYWISPINEVAQYHTRLPLVPQQVSRLEGGEKPKRNQKKPDAQRIDYSCMILW